MDLESIRRLNKDDTAPLVRVLELNGDRLYHWLFLRSVIVLRDDLDRSIGYIKALRKMVKSERPDYVSPYEAVLSL